MCLNAVHYEMLKCLGPMNEGADLSKVAKATMNTPFGAAKTRYNFEARGWVPRPMRLEANRLIIMKD